MESECPINAVRVTHREYKAWAGKPISDTYGKKCVLDWRGKPVFAELAIARQLEEEGWDAVWVDSYRRCFRRDLPPSKCELPDSVKAMYLGVVRENGGRRGGCWDVLAWRGNRFRFVESKRGGRDAIRPSQARWLEAAMRCGLTIDSFEIVEWTVAKAAGAVA